MDSDTNDFTFDLAESPQNHFAGPKRDGSDIVMTDRWRLDDETDNEDDETDDDDNNCLDLTTTPQINNSPNTTANESPTAISSSNSSPSASATSRTPPNSSTDSPSTLDLLVEDGISEEALVAMGIDINEIRAQKEIERRIESEAQQLEYAKQVEQQINSNGDNNQASTAAAWRNIGLGSSTQTPTAHPPPTASSSAVANGKAPMVPGRQLPTSFVSSPYNNSGYNNKRFKPNEPLTSSIGSSSSSGGNGSSNVKNRAESSTSAAASASTIGHRAPIVMIDSDDDDLVDLTNDSDGDINSTKPITVDWDDEEDEDDDDDQLIPGFNMDSAAILHQMYQIQQRQEAQRRYGILMSPLPTVPGMPYGSKSGLFNPSNHHFPKNNYPMPSSAPPLGSQISADEAHEQLRKLLENITDEEPPPPESRIGTPDGLRVNLMEHQKIGFQWMCKQEVSSNKGGMLCDDMGLGKTIQALSVIVARPCTNPDPLPPADLIPSSRKLKTRVEPIKTKCTLVVCPVSLVEQWAQEIESKSVNLSVYIHHGSRVLSSSYDIAHYDVVITSYNKLRTEYPDPETNRAPGLLHPLIFHRVILDEAHTIKNKATGAAKACYRIEANHRWCLTATPIQNKIEELYSLINFLRIQPYCDWTTFREEVVTPLKLNNHRGSVMKKVQLIMKAISIRRSKKATIDGRPILNLPERNVHFTHVDFPSEERRFYDFVDNKVQSDFNDYVEAGTVMQNYSSVLVLLLRLRQACLHAALTRIEKPVLKDDETKQMENAKALSQTVVDRLVGMKEELANVECPICMDAATEPRIISGCGHILCRECLSLHVNTNSDYGGQKSCPECRGELRLDTTVPVAIFFKMHIPELAKEEKKEDEELENKVKQLQFESSTKIDTMLDILRKTREDSNGRDKTIVFSQFTHMLDLMERPLKANGFKFGRYDGSMSVKARTAMIEKYRNDPSMEVLLVSTKCGCLGLNLTMANRVILMDVWWNPALENQAIDRVHRIGQTKDVEVHRLFINNTVEDRILELQKRKQLIADGALGEGNAEKLGRLGLQDMLYLFRGGPPPPMPNGSGAVAGPSSSAQ